MRGATRHTNPLAATDTYFNPRAPCGARRPISLAQFRACLFQSTRPMRGATTVSGHKAVKPHISIHAPHAGRDDNIINIIKSFSNFNPRAPCGARLILAVHQVSNVHISIHAPHAGRDDLRQSDIATIIDFNPRAPCGARRILYTCISVVAYFNPRAPCGARRAIFRLYHSSSKFQSTRPMRGATR